MPSNGVSHDQSAAGALSERVREEDMRPSPVSRSMSTTSFADDLDEHPLPDEDKAKEMQK